MRRSARCAVSLAVSPAPPREGAWRIRTAVRGFAGLCLTTRPRRRQESIVSGVPGTTPCRDGRRVPARTAFAPAAPRGGAGLPRVRPLQERHSGGVRRGSRPRRVDARGRAAGRQGGSRRPAVRRARRTAARPGARGGEHRPRADHVTNAVKHFKWQARGKRRIHQKPTWSEQLICRPWLEAELAAVKPRVLVCLGAIAAQSLLGRDFRVTKHRGELLDRSSRST